MGVTARGRPEPVLLQVVRAEPSGRGVGIPMRADVG
jgi:hypothetical protein